MGYDVLTGLFGFRIQQFVRVEIDGGVPPVSLVVKLYLGVIHPDVIFHQ